VFVLGLLATQTLSRNGLRGDIHGTNLPPSRLLASVVERLFWGLTSG
jgi:hypothetical protein